MRKLIVRGLCAVACLPLLIACSGESDPNGNGAANGGTAGSAGTGGNVDDDSGIGEDKLPLGCSRTDFDGDQNCIAAPDPSEGIQLHVGPSNYDDEAEMAKYLLGPGEENVTCYTVEAPNAETFYYFNQKNRMRGGSHHMIIRVLNDDAPVGISNCEPFGGGRGGIPGAQTQVRDVPGQTLAPENEGFGRELPPHAKVQFELHYVNLDKTKSVLREAWVNLYRKDPATITQKLRGISLIGGLAMKIPPNSEKTLTHACEITGDARIVDVFGHFHAHTRRFTAWRLRGEQRDLIYQSFNWAEPAELSFDSVNKNPQPNETTGTDGGWTNTLDVKAGDKIEWSCDINNTLSTEITFKNEAYTGEMCILFGNFVSQNTALRMFCAKP